MNWLSNTVLPKIKALVSPSEVQDNLWVKCTDCGQMIFHREFADNFNTCSACGNTMPMTPAARMAMLFDDGEYDTIALGKTTDDPLNFRDRKRYTERLKEARQNTNSDDAIMVAQGQIMGVSCVIAAFDFRFMGGSMGRLVGDGLLTAADVAVSSKSALITVPSSGGARMQEGILSLMQLPRTVIATRRIKEAGLPYIVLLAHPTTGGVTASFAMLGDIQLAEPGAIIGFAGRRVIEETVREKLPDDFQTAEYLFDHGMIDAVVARKDQRQTLARIIAMLMAKTSMPPYSAGQAH